MLEPDENFFEDGLTRRSAKLAQRALALALASRGALSECRTEGPAIITRSVDRVAQA